MAKYIEEFIAFKHKVSKYSSKSKSFSSGCQESPLITPKPANNFIFFNNKIEHFNKYISFKLKYTYLINFIFQR